MSSDVLESNLARYTSHALAADVRSCGGERAALRPTRSGAPALVLAGQALSTSIDPEEEARVWAEAQPLDKIDMAVVFGLGAGYHLEAIRRRSPLPIVVIEPSCDVIRATLGLRALAMDDLHIVGTPKALSNRLSRRLSVGVEIGLLSWPVMRRLFPDFLASTQSAVEHAAQMAGINAKTLEVRLSVWVDHLLENLPKIVGHVPMRALLPAWRGRPVICVAAGPSLDRNIDHLRAVQGRALIVAVNTAMGALEQAEVRADFIVALESLDVSTQLTDLKINRDCPRLLGLVANPALFANAPGPVYPFIDALSYFAGVGREAGLGAGLPLGGSVANAAFSLARELGSPQITLVGQDLAYAEGRIYASGTIFEAMRAKVSADQAEIVNREAKDRIAESLPAIDNTRARESVSWVRGWREGRVCTNAAFNYFRCVFEDWADQSEGIELINATEGGAAIHGFAPERLLDVIARLPRTPSPFSFPTQPVITRQMISTALGAAKMRCEDALRCIEAASRSEANDDIQGARDALRASGLLYAYAWSPVVHLMRNTQPRLPEIYTKIVESGDALLRRIAQAQTVVAD